MNQLALLFLIGAILCEVIATTALKSSQGFSHLIPSLIVVAGYAGAFYLLSQALKLHMPLGMAYAIWSGVGTALIAIVGLLLFKETLNWVSIIGIVLIIAGVVILNLSTNSHG